MAPWPDWCPPRRPHSGQEHMSSVAKGLPLNGAQALVLANPTSAASFFHFFPLSRWQDFFAGM